MVSYTQKPKHEETEERLITQLWSQFDESGPSFDYLIVDKAKRNTMWDMWLDRRLGLIESGLEEYRQALKQVYESGQISLDEYGKAVSYNRFLDAIDVTKRVYRNNRPFPLQF